MRDVAIIGIGCTKFGELWTKSLRELVVEAGLLAIQDANITSNDIEAIYGSSMASDLLTHQLHLGPLICDSVGLKNIPSVVIECGEASGGAALHQGYIAIASGLYDIVVVGGVEKITDVGAEKLMLVQSTTLDIEWETFVGATVPALYALIARKYMYDFNITEEQLALVPVKNHKHGKLNPLAQYKYEITVDNVLKSHYVASPLRVLNCASPCDGATAVVLCVMDKAKKLENVIPIKIFGSVQSVDAFGLASKNCIYDFTAVSIATKKALEQAKITHNDISIIELHDNFSITELILLESMGFCDKGKSIKMIEAQECDLNGRLPTNTSGGLKARGYPFGATGIAQIYELVLQLRGKADKRQTKDAKYALAINIGGSGSSACAHILGSEI